MVALLLSALLLQAPPERPRIAVVEFNAGGGIQKDVADALAEAVTAEISSRGFFSVMSYREIQTMISVERQKQLLGCAEDATNCLAELAGALGARFVLSGSVTRLGDTLQLTLTTIDTTKSQPLGRSTRLAKDMGTLRSTLPYAVAEATATPPPPAPSRIVPISLIAGGALGLVAGGIVGQDALSEERAIDAELSRGVGLDTFGSYQRRADDITLRKRIALGALVAGAALLGAGIYLWQPSEASGSVQVALTPVDGSQLVVQGRW